jgi:hypothetical protein
MRSERCGGVCSTGLPPGGSPGTQTGRQLPWCGSAVPELIRRIQNQPDNARGITPLSLSTSSSVGNELCVCLSSSCTKNTGNATSDYRAFWPEGASSQEHAGLRCGTDCPGAASNVACAIRFESSCQERVFRLASRAKTARTTPPTAAIAPRTIGTASPVAVPATHAHIPPTIKIVEKVRTPLIASPIDALFRRIPHSLFIRTKNVGPEKNSRPNRNLQGLWSLF